MTPEQDNHSDLNARDFTLSPEQETLKVFQSQLAARDAEIERLREALDEIENPIKYMRKQLKDGETLNGVNAIALSNDANYLKSIATKALTKKQ